MSPLWVISLFVTLSEVVAGLAVTQATGGIQIALTVFVIAFPLYIATMFFVCLWKKHESLFPPGEISTEYTQNMLRLREVVRQSQTVLKQREFEQDKMIEIVNKAVRVAVPENDASKAATIEAVRQIDMECLTVDSRIFSAPTGKVRKIPYNPLCTVSAFLNDIYFSLSTSVEAFTYGEQWVLRNMATNQVLEGGKQWALRRGKSMDDRTLPQAGIESGTTFRVERGPRFQATPLGL